MQAERMTEPITGGPAIARQLWVVACAPLVVVPIAQLALDESVARWAHARELVSSAFLQWSTELGESTYWLVPLRDLRDTPPTQSCAMGFLHVRCGRR